MNLKKKPKNEIDTCRHINSLIHLINFIRSLKVNNSYNSIRTRLKYNRNTIRKCKLTFFCRIIFDITAMESFKGNRIVDHFF